MSNATPQLTDEQRKAALEKASETREERAKLKEAIKEGRYTLSDFIAEDGSIRAEWAESNVYKRMRVYDFIRCHRTYGDKKAEALMKELGIAKTRRMGGLGHRQAKRLLAVFA